MNDREKLIELLESSRYWGSNTSAEIADHLLANGVTVQKHGRWEKKWHDNDLIGREYEECPVCGCMISDTEKFWDCNFCPNCGADMRGE